MDATPHTFSESGISFLLTLKYPKNNEFFGFGASTSYTYVNNATNSVGQSASITISTASTSFKINSFASYVASNTGGGTPTNGTVPFVGTLVGGSTATATLNVRNTSFLKAGKHTSIVLV